MSLEVTILEPEIFVITNESDIVTVTTTDPSPSQTGITFEDEGVALGTRGTVNEIDFVGAGVSAARSGDKVTVTISSSGSGISGLTANRVPYAASATSLTDSASLTWDNTNKKLRVGVADLYAYSRVATPDIYLTTSGGSTASYGNNVVIGHDMPAGDMDVGNIIMGHSAGKLSTSHYNVLLGEAAGRFQTTAGENVAIGYRALYQNLGEDNIGIGFGPAQNYAGTGRNITFIGYYAGSPTASGASGTDLTSGGAHSIFIGSYVNALHATETGQINIGGVFFARGNGGSNPPPHPEVGNASVFVTNPTARWHLPAGAAAANKAPQKFTAGTNLTTPEAGAMEYDNTFHLTNSDATRRHIVLAPNNTKVTAAAPYTNDGYVVVNIGGTDFKLMTTA